MKSYLLVLLLLLVPLSAYADDTPPFLTFLHNLINYNAQIENQITSNSSSPIIFSSSNGTSLSFDYSSSTDPYSFTYAGVEDSIAFKNLQTSYSNGNDILITGTESPPTGLLTITLKFNNSTIQSYKVIEDMQGNFETTLSPNHWQSGTYQIIASSSLHQITDNFNLD